MTSSNTTRAAGTGGPAQSGPPGPAMQTDITQVPDLVRQFGLLPHPEGGYYRETYRCAQTVRPMASSIERSASTAIYYLLDGGAYSAWHRIASDEIWHFYAGSPLLVHVLLDDARIATHRLGNALHSAGSAFQAIVPKGSWFAAELAQPDSFAFVGCTVAPGFEFSELELAGAADLLPWSERNAALVQRLLKAS